MDQYWVPPGRVELVNSILVRRRRVLVIQKVWSKYTSRKTGAGNEEGGVV